LALSRSPDGFEIVRSSEQTGRAYSGFHVAAFDPKATSAADRFRFAMLSPFAEAENSDSSLMAEVVWGVTKADIRAGLPPNRPFSDALPATR
jgi:hypothetical protein